MSDPTSEARDHPMTVIAVGLTAAALGEPVDQDAMQDAGAVVAAANLLRGGMSMDAIEKVFERPHVFKFTYDRATDEIGIDIEWDDEEDGVR